MSKKDGHDSQGKFAPGNKFGRGNPHGAIAAKFRSMLVEGTTEGDMQAICRRLIEGAKKGDLAFIREYFDRVLGKAAQDTTIRVESKYRQMTKEEIAAEKQRLLLEIRAGIGTRAGTSPNGPDGGMGGTIDAFGE